MSLIDAQKQPFSEENASASLRTSESAAANLESVPLPTSSAAPSADAKTLLAPYHPFTIEDLRAAANQKIIWMWDGYLAAGGITLLTGMWKGGKTTLIAVLLDRLRNGGMIGGKAVRAGRAVVVSEEGTDLWALRTEKWTFGDHVTWLCQPFKGKPTVQQWLDLLDRLAVLRDGGGVDLLIIDTLASFLPGRDENTAATVLEMLMPLQRLTSRGVSVLLPHHPRKRPSPAGMAARGSGALPAHVDIIVEMEHFAPADDLDRRRRFRAYSRYDQTPVQSILELNEAGDDFVHLGDFAQTEFGDGWERLLRMLESAPSKLRCDEIIADWPKDDPPRPGETSLRRWLDKAFADGRVSREGAGTRKDPFLFWLPGKEVEWPDDPLWFLRGEIDPFDPGKEETERIRQDRRRRAKE
jgi:hypothetical protein